MALVCRSWVCGYMATCVLNVAGLSAWQKSTMDVPTAEQARATASSPSVCAMRCIAMGATKTGMLNVLPAWRNMCHMCIHIGQHGLRTVCISAGAEAYAAGIINLCSQDTSHTK